MESKSAPSAPTGMAYITKNCGLCKQEQTIVATKAQWERHERGNELIQDVFPELTPGQREFLISGICEACFDNLFKEEE